jgi:hypothetical protein
MNHLRQSCVNLTEVVQWLRLALSKGPNWVGVFSTLSPEDGNRSSFRNVVFSSLWNTGRWKSPKKNSNPVCYTPSSEPFRIYQHRPCINIHAFSSPHYTTIHVSTWLAIIRCVRCWIEGLCCSVVTLKYSKIFYFWLFLDFNAFVALFVWTCQVMFCWCFGYIPLRLCDYRHLQELIFWCASCKKCYTLRGGEERLLYDAVSSKIIKRRTIE